MTIIAEELAAMAARKGYTYPTLIMGLVERVVGCQVKDKDLIDYVLQIDVRKAVAVPVGLKHNRQHALLPVCREIFRLLQTFAPR